MKKVIQSLVLDNRSSLRCHSKDWGNTLPILKKYKIDSPANFQKWAQEKMDYIVAMTAAEKLARPTGLEAVPFATLTPHVRDLAAAEAFSSAPVGAAEKLARPTGLEPVAY